MTAKNGGRFALASYSFLLAAVIAFVAFRALPVRNASVDSVALALVVLRVASGIGVIARSDLGLRLARWVAVATLLVGLLATTLLAMSVSVVAGLYDSVGQGSAVAFALAMLLFVPYLIVFPALELRALAPRPA